MSLKYNIAILDDQKVFYDEYKDFINNYLQEKGFMVDIDYLPSEHEFNGYELGKPDLYMIDLKFGADDKGQKFIEKIRDDYVTDILFYSSDHNAIESYRKNLNMQGIFFAEKDDQADEVDFLLRRLLDKMILKASAPRSTRGIVMECVAELDDIVKQKISLLESKLNSEQRYCVNRKIIKLYKDSFDGQNKRLENFFATPFVGNKIPLKEIFLNARVFSLQDLIKDFRISDSQKNLDCLLIVYKKLRGENELYGKIKAYQDLLKKRNILAHVIQEKNKNGYYIFKHQTDTSEYYELTPDEIISIRKNIITLEKQISAIT